MIDMNEAQRERVLTAIDALTDNQIGRSGAICVVSQLEDLRPHTGMYILANKSTSIKEIVHEGFLPTMHKREGHFMFHFDNVNIELV